MSQLALAIRSKDANSLSDLVLALANTSLSSPKLLDLARRVKFLLNVRSTRSWTSGISGKNLPSKNYLCDGSACDDFSALDPPTPVRAFAS